MNAPLAELPPPRLVEDNLETLAADITQRYETDSQKALQPAHVDRLLVRMLSYVFSLLCSAINSAGRQNLVRFARGLMLDHLAERAGVQRIGAQAAQADVRLILSEVARRPWGVPAGTRVAAGSQLFVVVEDTPVRLGSTIVHVRVQAITAGPDANGLALGQINALIDDIGVAVATVNNTTVTAGGADEEDDERLRSRVLEAPAAFSTAGSVAAYRFHARSAHQDIVDVAVLSPTPGDVRLYPLVRTGLPDAAMRQRVAEVCSADRVRPLTDHVQVLAPVAVPWTWEAVLTLRAAAVADTALIQAQTRARAFVEGLSQRLANDVVPRQLIGVLLASEVYDVALTTPTDIVAVSAEAWAACTGIVLTVAATRHD